MNIIRNHLKIFYDELWAEHIYLSTGKRIKPFKDRHEFGKCSLSEGFIKQKPSEFHKVDDLLLSIIPSNTVNWLITLADNRMMQGDYRYGSILRQNLNNYHVDIEFYKRLSLAYKTKNLDYVCDSYNMIRIQYYKTKYFMGMLKFIIEFRRLWRVANSENWQLDAIDDGYHAQEFKYE